MEQLRNQHLTIEVSEMGAELQSIKDAEGREYLWQGGEKWPRRSPILFPLVCSVENDTYYVDGQAYHLPRHGFASDTKFTLIHQTETKLTYALHESEETLKVYPFRFNLAVTYRLSGNKIHVIWHVENTDVRDLHFQIGGHPAFLAPGCREDEPLRGIIALDNKQPLKGLKSYIDDNYVAERSEEEYLSDAYPQANLSRRERAGMIQRRRRKERESIDGDGAVGAALPQPAIPEESRASAASLEDILRQHEKTFSEYLLDLLKERKGKDSEVYKRAEVSKQLFSKILNNPDYQPSEKKRKPMKSEKIPYPENLLTDIGLDLFFESNEYTELNEDQLAGLCHALKSILPREQEMIRLRYEEHETLQAIGDRYGLSRERVRQVIAKGVRKMRHPSRTVFIRNGLQKAELALKIACAEEMKKQLQAQRKRYPLMNEEDVVKFAFQGMLGVGHLISSVDDAKNRLAAEMAALEPDESEPLIEKISTDWVRLNLRPAKAKGMTEDELAWYLVRSAERGSLSFTRQNVYNFCVKLDGSDRMKAAAEKVLDDSWLPSHSAQYREAYRPAYRVLYKAFRKFKADEN